MISTPTPTESTPMRLPQAWHGITMGVCLCLIRICSTTGWAYKNRDNIPLGWSHYNWPSIGTLAVFLHDCHSRDRGQLSTATQLRPAYLQFYYFHPTHHIPVCSKVILHECPPCLRYQVRWVADYTLKLHCLQDWKQWSNLFCCNIL